MEAVAVVWSLGFLFVFFPMLHDNDSGMALAGATFWPVWLVILAFRGLAYIGEHEVAPQERMQAPHPRPSFAGGVGP